MANSSLEDEEPFYHSINSPFSLNPSAAPTTPPLIIGLPCKNVRIMGSWKGLLQLLQLKRGERGAIAALLSPRRILALQVNITVLVGHGAAGARVRTVAPSTRPVVQTVAAAASGLSSTASVPTARRSTTVACGRPSAAAAASRQMRALQLQEVRVVLLLVMRTAEVRVLVVGGRQQVMVRMVLQEVVLRRTALDRRAALMGNILH